MRICSVPGCCEKHHAKGYCQKHYNQSRSHKYAIPDNRDRRIIHNVFRPVNTTINNNNTDILDHCLMELKDMIERIDRLK